jgi:hypothetical protein
MMRARRWLTASVGANSLVNRSFRYRWLLLLAFGLAGCDFKTSDGDVDQAIARIEAGDFKGAAAAFDAAAASLPETPELNFGRGVARVQIDDEQAVAMLLRALETRDPQLRQRVHAALGVAHARKALKLEAENPVEAGQPLPEEVMKAWEQAVAFLEDALALNPADVDARTNLEVALLRVDPPCATRDDAMEENDSAGTARLLTLAAGETEGAPEGQAQPKPEGPPKLEDLMKFQEQLFSCPDDDDWYRIDAHPGDRFEFKLTVPEGKGRLRMQVFDAANRLIGEGATLSHAVPLDAAPGPLFVSIANIDVEEVSYALAVELRPACKRVEDRFESNDTALDARSVTPGPVPDIKLCPGNDDWFAVELAEGESVFVYAEPAEAGENDKKDEAADKDAIKPSPLLLDVFRGFDEAGALVVPDDTTVPLTRGGQAGRARIATLLMPPPGRYYFRVRGATPDFEGRYALRLEIVPPCPEGDDRFEDNDLPEDPADFDEAAAGPAPDPAAEADAQAAGTITVPSQQQGPPVVFARICPGDVDWWRVTDDLSQKQPAIVSLTFDHGQGDLAMTLYDERGVEVLMQADASTAEQSGEIVVLPRPEVDPAAPAPAPAPDGGDPAAAKKPFLLKIEGKEGSQNFYLLRLDRPSAGGGGGEDGEKQDDSEKQDGDKQDGDKQDGDKQDGDKQDGDKQDDDQKQPPQPDPASKPEQARPLEDVLDKLDRNPENLEARDSARKTPLAGQKPVKDW